MKGGFRIYLGAGDVNKVTNELGESCWPWETPQVTLVPLKHDVRRIVDDLREAVDGFYDAIEDSGWEVRLKMLHVLMETGHKALELSRDSERDNTATPVGDTYRGTWSADSDRAQQSRTPSTAESVPDYGSIPQRYEDLWCVKYMNA